MSLKPLRQKEAHNVVYRGGFISLVRLKAYRLPRRNYMVCVI